MAGPQAVVTEVRQSGAGGMTRPIVPCLNCGDPHEFSPDLSGICPSCETPEDKAATARFLREGFQARVRNSGIPRALCVDEWPDTVATAAAQEWAAGKRPGLVLTGGVGVLKTTLAGAAAYRMLRDRSVTWLSVAALMSTLRASFDDDQRAQAIHHIQGIGPLVLDDLDKAKPTDFAKEVLFTAIDQRIVNRVPLLVTTNLDMDSIADRMGDPIASRLFKFRPIEMTGGDRRLEARA
ncbi:MAG: ATP-binding protein [Solirubrobacterales bacterium]|nr:ATP-binding protein [Solirubrobacterales bacterium]